MQSDLRESFPSLEDRATGAGVTLAASIEGQSSAGQQGAIGFAFKDAAGNVVLPQLDNEGRVPVTLSGQGTRLRNYGSKAGALLSATGAFYGNQQLVTSIDLTANTDIGDFGGKVNCRRAAYFELRYEDNGASVVLDSSLVDAGQYTAPLGAGPQEDTFHVPASAVAPKISIYAGNLDNGKLSDLRGMLTVLQF